MEAAKSGVRHCEIALPSNDDHTPGQWRRLLERTGLDCWSFHIPFGAEYDLSAPDSGLRAHALGAALRAVDLAASLGADVMVVHAGAEPVPTKARSEHLAAAQRSLVALAQRCAILGRKLAVEFLPRSCPGNSVGELEYLLAGLDSRRVGVCLDLNHANLGQNLEANILALSGRILTIHASDNDGIDERHWLPGQGVIDWCLALRALEQAGYQGPFVYESSSDRRGGQVGAQGLLANYDEFIRPLIPAGESSG